MTSPLVDYVALYEEGQKQFHVTCGTRSVVSVTNKWRTGWGEKILYCEHCKLVIEPSYAKEVVR